ncbi:MAG: TonB-dependent copper receptor [Gammaproteobacteria bacterium]|nr:TonB-dependent copper receptor [Gammaproteobacteria bacterium]
MSTRTCVRMLAPALMLAVRLLHAADHPTHVIDPSPETLSGADAGANGKGVQRLTVVVVTATAEHSPLRVEADARAPRQPLPAHDGADFLKTIAGFAVTRKAGTDGDPVFRGMAGSRLNIVVDGANILGGCNARMDAPTAYIFPEAFDVLTVIKGPQSVRHGPGTSAGTVMFERRVERFAAPGYRFRGSLLGASAGRHDEVADLRLGRPLGYLQFTATNSQSDDYEDGDGNAVHSAYRRYSVNAAAAWTPDEHTRLELSLVHSDGHAAYADRAMDGTQFLRQGFELSFERRDLPGRLQGMAARVYASSVDHVMDDQELRTPGMMGYADLRRFTYGARAAVTLATLRDSRFELGLDTQINRHDSRSAPPSGMYMPFRPDAHFAQQGVFAEWTLPFGRGRRLVGGYRLDRWHSEDERLAIGGMMGAVPNSTAGATRNEWRYSGFTRIEAPLRATAATLYAGIGHAERFPDYWEAIAKESPMSRSAFDSVRSEKTTQLDAGIVYRTATTTFTLALFASRVGDFILVDYGSMMKPNGAIRNVAAASHGGEIGVSRALGPRWRADAALAWVQGENRGDGRPLPQIPPLDARLGLEYAAAKWSSGVLLRAVAAQNRFDIHRGTIVGKDLGAAPGFAILSLNGGWRLTELLQLTAGVDNVLDRSYAEFISRAGGNGMGGAIGGYVQTTRVNEPGRTLWVKLVVRTP